MVHLMQDANTHRSPGRPLALTLTLTHKHTHPAKHTKRAIQAQTNNMTHTGDSVGKDREQWHRNG